MSSAEKQLPRFKVAVLGGTFNPIHNGHLDLAEALVQQLALQELLLLPCHIPPHRAVPKVASHQRAAMVNCAIANSAKLVLDERELTRGGTSYSFDTLVELREKYGPACSLSFVVGCDAYLGLMNWHRWDELLDYAHILVAKRPGWTLPKTGGLAEFTQRFGAGIDALNNHCAGRVVLLDTLEQDVSSTQIRTLIAKGLPVQHLIPAAVQQYIKEHNLYE